MTLNTPTLAGEVKSFRMDDDGNVFCLVEWDDANAKKERWFKEDELIAQ